MHIRQALRVEHSAVCHARNWCLCETNRYVFILFIYLIVFAGEFFGAHASGSLSLKADSFHALVDGVATLPNIAVAVSAVTALRAHEKNLRCGVAVFNGILLLGASILIFRDAWERYQNPQEVHALAMIAIATLALFGNSIALWILGPHSHGSHAITHTAMQYHIVSDLGQSATVVVSGIAIHFSQKTAIDLILSIAIAVLISFGAVRLFIKTARMP